MASKQRFYRRMEQNVRWSNTCVARLTDVYVQSSIDRGFGRSRGDIIDIAMEELIKNNPEFYTDEEKEEKEDSTTE